MFNKLARQNSLSQNQYFMHKLNLILLFSLSSIVVFAQVIDPDFAPKILRVFSGYTIATQPGDILLVVSQARGYT